MAKKSRKPRPAVWSFYSAALRRLLSEAWTDVSKEWNEQVLAAFRSGDSTIAKQLLTETQKLSTALRKVINKPVDAVLLAAQREARIHWEDHLDEVRGKKKGKEGDKGENKPTSWPRITRKADTPTNLLSSPAEYSALLWSAHAEQIKRIAETYPERLLHPELQRLLDLMPSHETANVIDLQDIAKRVERVLSTPTPWERLSTVEVARLWNADGLLLAKQNGIERCQIIAILDQLTCPVCEVMHGQEIVVSRAVEKIQSDMSIEDPGEYAAAWKFPRFTDVQLASPDKITDMNLMPPFHSHCRCSVRYLYAGASAGRVGEKPNAGSTRRPLPGAGFTKEMVDAFNSSYNHFSKMPLPELYNVVLQGKGENAGIRSVYQFLESAMDSPVYPMDYKGAYFLCKVKDYEQLSGPIALPKHLVAQGLKDEASVRELAPKMAKNPKIFNSIDDSANYARARAYNQAVLDKVYHEDKIYAYRIVSKEEGADDLKKTISSLTESTNPDVTVKVSSNNVVSRGVDNPNVASEFLKQKKLIIRETVDRDHVLFLPDMASYRGGCEFLTIPKPEQVTKISDISIKASKDRTFNPAVAPKIEPTVPEYNPKIKLPLEELNRRSKLLEKHFTQDEIADMQDCVNRVFDSTTASVRTSPKTLDKIVIDGRFKTMFEVDDTQGSFDPIGRTMVEYQYFGTMPDPKFRPVSGYMSTSGDKITAAMYGNVEVQLKKGALQSATFTNGDSLGNNYSLGKATSQAGSVKDRTLGAFVNIDAFNNEFNTITNLKELRGLSAQCKKVNTALDMQKAISVGNPAYDVGYMELQFHNGLTTDMIESIVFHKGKPSQAVIDWAEESGVKIISGKGK